jgi:hypothetical protein
MNTYRQLAFFLFFILFLIIPVCSITAQDSFIIPDFEPVMARVDDGVRFGIILSAESFSSNTSLYYENELELEDWMLDTGNCGGGMNAQLHFNVRVESVEQDIPLEDWMLAPAITSERFFRKCVREDTEEDLALEPWMLVCTSRD